MKPFKFKQRFVGNWCVGHENVRVFCNGLGGASVDESPRDQGCAAMYIGLNHRTFDEVIELLMHEACELWLIRAGLHYIRSTDFRNATDCYTMIIPHDRFTQMCGFVSYFIFHAQPKVKRAWREHERARKAHIEANKDKP